MLCREVKQQLKSQPSVEEGDADSRMETERMVDRRDKKAAKGKGLRGSGKSGGQSSSQTVSETRSLSNCSLFRL